MWKLAIEDDEGKRIVVPLTLEQYTIGRKDGNTIRLTERNVSREHARIYKKNGSSKKEPADAGGAGFVVEDLTSYNGVFVNGLRVTHAQTLSHGDLVQIGDYRIVLQDESPADAPPPPLSNDVKQTVPGVPSPRAAAALERPNRLIMLAGPTPGSEHPLDRERLTIGRAEDAGISVNHNSVSRIHCEVHALDDGRFEILDKESSNGVRVNGTDLRRGIIESGDIIELGDVQFKFVRRPTR
jgi:ABC transport system ATP-binding/permease protein